MARHRSAQRSARGSRPACPQRATHARSQERRACPARPRPPSEPRRQRPSRSPSAAWRSSGARREAPSCGGAPPAARPRRREGKGVPRGRDGAMASSARVAERRSAGAMSPPLLFSLPEARHRFTVSSAGRRRFFSAAAARSLAAPVWSSAVRCLRPRRARFRAAARGELCEKRCAAAPSSHGRRRRSLRATLAASWFCAGFGNFCLFASR